MFNTREKELPMPPFVKIEKQRKPGPGEKEDPKCSGTGRIDNHVCMTCHGSGVIPDPAAKKGNANASSDSDGNGNGS